MYIPDPTELLDQQMENQFDLVDENDKYPCYYCGRRFNIDKMYPISDHPATPLCCGRKDCTENN